MSCPYHAKKKAENDAKEANAKAEQGKVLDASEEAAVKAVESNDPNAQKLLKTHFKTVYDLVGEKAAAEPEDAVTPERLAAAQGQARRLGYSEEQIAALGEDAVRMQGTGNPHAVAAVAAGETVVDLGSGLGVDALLAGMAVGARGRVIGVDQAEREVAAAIKRTAGRKVRNVDFRLGDMEDVPVDDGTVDVVLSNGGFCLVPNKSKAFEEIHRVLKPGGRFAINCTVRLVELPEGGKWPSCFHVFMALKDVKDLVTGAGFPEPEITFPAEKTEEEKAEAEELAKKKKGYVHRGSETYSHLSGMDMDSMFNYVTISATKAKN